MDKMIAVIRIRGSIKVREKVLDTLSMLNLTRANHMVIVKDSPTTKGMIKKVNDYITWGEVNEDTIEKVLLKRGRLEGDKRLDSKFFEEKKIDSKKLASMYMKDPKSVFELGVKKVFRLTPPSKGFERGGIKRPVNMKGALGYRGDKISALIEKMI